MNQPEVKTTQSFPEAIFKDPVLTFLLLPFLPLIQLTQSINSMFLNISNMPATMPSLFQAAQPPAAAGNYKNDETWVISEDKNGNIKIKVERLAQRK